LEELQDIMPQFTDTSSGLQKLDMSRFTHRDLRPWQLVSTCPQHNQQFKNVLVRLACSHEQVVEQHGCSNQKHWVGWTHGYEMSRISANRYEAWFDSCSLANVLAFPSFLTGRTTALKRDCLRNHRCLFADLSFRAITGLPSLILPWLVQVNYIPDRRGRDALDTTLLARMSFAWLDNCISRGAPLRIAADIRLTRAQLPAQ